MLFSVGANARTFVDRMDYHSCGSNLHSVLSAKTAALYQKVPGPGRGYIALGILSLENLDLFGQISKESNWEHKALIFASLQYDDYHRGPLNWDNPIVSVKEAVSKA